MKNLNIDSSLSIADMNLIKVLTSLISKFTVLMAGHGIKVKAFSEGANGRLATLSSAELNSILKSFESYYRLCVHAAANEIDLSNTRQFLKAGLDYLGFSAPNDFYDTIANDDLVEVYDLHHRQVFRNIHFYDVTSYSLADLLTFAWAELYDRSSLVTTSIFSVIENVLSSSSVRTSIPMVVPFHVLKEVMAAPLQTCDVRFKFMAPVFDKNDDKCGYVCNCTANPLGAEAGQALDFI